ncbi:hypothetical protein S820908_075 [Synechococcus phage S-CAM9]|uniref:Uncharacterized protein n=1 Tax=Synechococcus phage S-CAM9 TaxID=1883369 RepID=A0A1D8KPV8_9CAUD|nr:L-shaped tail fiber protein assembly [Synechococcus phage S-CAM9]AOV60223.1 hypothetical protein S050808_076 [Synechococcus phage S-CAM9]AOV60450.1 hypothetical protein S820908_075 [Synechococcus phage S-CAM9]AOV60679.1 hypothetical protein N161109_076 [Synechococcus phage S-CAM9]
MAIYVVNVIIDQGADFQQTFDLAAANNQPLDLTGCTASAQLRKHAGSKNRYDFTVDFTDRENGQVKISLTDTITKRIKAGRYLYDFILTDTNLEKIKIVEGSALVRESVTRE